MMKRQTNVGELNTVLEVRDLGVTLPLAGKPVRVIDEINFDVQRGSTLGIVGESGGGKSLLSRSLLRLLPEGAKLTGTVAFYSRSGKRLDLFALKPQELREVRGKGIGLLFQEPATSMNPVMTCGRQVFDALADPLRKQKAEGVAKVMNLLRLAGLDSPTRVAGAYPHELSGGMLQRVALAAALAGEPSVLIADEPTSALDASARMKLLQTLANLQTELGLTLILISHDLGMISTWADRLLVIYHGRIVESGQTRDLMSFPSHPYTKALLKTAHSFEEGRLPEAIPGEIPSLVNPPPGCRFHPRCDFADSRCRMDEPELLPASHGGNVRCHYPL